MNRDRRSTRLSISVPVIISGVDADGNSFSETVRTLVVNKHGGKIATTRRLTINTELVIENRPLGVVVKASVAWLGEKKLPGDLNPVGVQLLEAKDVWGIAFPPDDWHSETREDALPTPDDPPAPEPTETVDPGSQVSSLAGEEITIRLLQELQESADAHAREFQERLKQLTHRLGLELEFDLRERAAYARAREVGALAEEIKVLRESLSAAREEIGKLEDKIQKLQAGLEVNANDPPPLTPPLQEARRQLTALTNSAIESMNRAAAAGLSEYRSLLQKENQESAARLRPGPDENPPSPGS